jgi:hypothetical protein
MGIIGDTGKGGGGVTVLNITFPYCLRRWSNKMKDAGGQSTVCMLSIFHYIGYVQNSLLGNDNELQATWTLQQFPPFSVFTVIKL